MLSPKPSIAAGNSCNPALDFSYSSVSSPNVLNSIDRIRLTVGAGTVSGGSGILTLSQVFFDLDCTKASISASNCVDDGAVVGYVGNISTSCTSNSNPVTITTNVAGSDPHNPGATAPNEVVFTFSPAIDIPSATPSYCWFEFDVQMRAQQSNDTTPLIVEQRAGVASASCDNLALFSALSATGSLDLDQPPPQCRGVTCVVRKRPKRCQ
ncbi:MAG TPA: hypothetical protein VMW17_23210 [Candidatus Binatia bacterium]|nr:hypothetical protein [Candidatus Binatia bacterium]